MIFLIILLCNTSLAFGEDFDVYCKKNIKEKYSSKKKKNICWCVEDNLRSQLSSEDRIWLIQNPSKNKRSEASVEPSDVNQKRIKDVEFQVFKNCSGNYKWKANHDDLGVPDDITAP